MVMVMKDIQGRRLCRVTSCAACQELLQYQDVVHHGYLRRRYAVHNVVEAYLTKSSVIPKCKQSTPLRLITVLFSLLLRPKTLCYGVRLYFMCRRINSEGCGKIFLNEIF